MPERGFGWVWADQVGVRQRLGWANGSEQPYTMRYQSGLVDSPGPRPPIVDYYMLPGGQILRLEVMDGGGALWSYA